MAGMLDLISVSERVALTAYVLAAWMAALRACFLVEMKDAILDAGRVA